MYDEKQEKERESLVTRLLVDDEAFFCITAYMNDKISSKKPKYRQPGTFVKALMPASGKKISI